MAPLGTILQISDSTFSWQIPGFYDLVKSQDLGVHSPDLMYQGTSWDIAMYKTAKNSVHFTNFSLWRKSYAVVKSRLEVNYRLFIKDQRGKQYWWSVVVSNEFDYDKREGTPQTLRDVDVLRYIYYNTPSDVFSLYVTFDSAQTSLIRTGSLRLPRRNSLIMDMIRRRGSFSQAENDESDDRMNDSSPRAKENEQRVYSSSFSSSDTQQKPRKRSFISALKRRASLFMTSTNEGVVINDPPRRNAANNHDTDPTSEEHHNSQPEDGIFHGQPRIKSSENTRNTFASCSEATTSDASSELEFSLEAICSSIYGLNVASPDSEPHVNNLNEMSSTVEANHKGLSSSQSPAFDKSFYLKFQAVGVFQE